MEYGPQIQYQLQMHCPLLHLKSHKIDFWLPSRMQADYRLHESPPTTTMLSRPHVGGKQDEDLRRGI